jgi:hypothetical protein
MRIAALTLRRRISCTSVPTIRAPEQPSGCPSATAPPLTLTLLKSVAIALLVQPRDLNSGATVG